MGAAAAAVVVISMCATGLRVAAQMTDPLIGTWVLNVAKSTFSPGPPPKSITVTFTAAGQGIRSVAETVGPKGETTRTDYTGNYDGKDYPIKGSPDSDTVVLKRIDPNTTERADKKAGKLVMTYVRRVAPDGKFLNVMQKGTDSQGRAVSNVLFLDKK
jgi:hypothetical protein